MGTVMGRIMARGAIAKLSPRKVETETKPGLLADGGNLYLQITATGAKTWIFRYTSPVTRKVRDMGLGAFPTIALAAARRKAEATRQICAAGIDPIEQRKANDAATALAAAKVVTFEECSAAYIKAHKAGWRNAKHGAQWTATLKAYASPVFGTLPVQAIDTALILTALEPIWETKTETASRVRSRIENILDWARARGFRDGENPARWRGHLDSLLPSRAKVQKVEHHPALSYRDIGAFIADLRGHAGIAARALEFAILTASRTGEAVGARWNEIDLAEKIWTIPAERTKAGREHRVPLSDRCIEILDQMRGMPEGEFVFPGVRPARPLSNMAMAMLVRGMNGDSNPPVWRDRRGAAIVPHGFRSTFKDWATEQTAFANEVSEAALAHVVGDKVEAAYRRGDIFEKRRKLMDAWSEYCGAVRADSANVVALRAAG
jgi:integrase